MDGGTSDSIDILSNFEDFEYNWVVVCDSGWLNPAPDSGQTPGRFMISADSNVSGINRTAEISIFIVGENQPLTKLTVTQNSKHGLIQVGNYTPPYCSEALFVEGNYAYMGGCMGGLIVVDIADSSHPFDYSWHTSECREKRIFKSDGYVYVAGIVNTNPITSMVEIYDVSDPYHPAPRSRIDTDFTYGVAVSDNYLFLADYDKLKIYNISDPANPVSVTGITTSGGTLAAAIYQDYLLFSEENTGIRIYDISDPENPSPVGSYSLDGLVNDICISGHFAFLACYNNCIKILNLDDPDNPVLIGEYLTDGEAYRICTDGNYLYVAVLANSVEMVDISDLTNPLAMASFCTPSQIYGVGTSNGFVYAIDREHGLFTLKYIP